MASEMVVGRPLFGTSSRGDRLGHARHDFFRSTNTTEDPAILLAALLATNRRRNMSHKHTLTFEADLSSDEMERAAILGHPKVVEARKALAAAFEEAGAPHASTSKVTRSMPGKEPRKPRAPKLLAE